ncbi:MAG: Mo-dependent nitrogenase C-terminal domain-containing protein [Thermostichus sp. DG_1_6_bins_120]
MTSMYLKPAARLRDWLQAPLQPFRATLDNFEVRDRHLAHRICRWIPAQCPFERDVVLFGRRIMHIPAMCKLNPLYDQVVSLRFRALSFLAEQGEDVTPYLQ